MRRGVDQKSLDPSLKVLHGMAETHEELAILAGSPDLPSELGPPPKSRWHVFCHSGNPGSCLIGIHTCPGKGGRLPVHATWPWFSCREIWDMFWPVEEEDWMSFTPGTWTTEELGEGDTFIPRKWPAFLSLCQKIPHRLSFLPLPPCSLPRGPCRLLFSASFRPRV